MKAHEVLGEKAPPGKKAKRFIKKAKKDFQKRYGDAWKQVLYATAWKIFGESIEEGSDIRPAKIDAAIKRVVGKSAMGYGGGCAVFAVALGRVLGDGAEFVVFYDEDTHPEYVDHVAVKFKGRYYDASGVTSREKLRDMGRQTENWGYDEDVLRAVDNNGVFNTTPPLDQLEAMLREAIDQQLRENLTEDIFAGTNLLDSLWAASGLKDGGEHGMISTGSYASPYRFRTEVSGPAIEFFQSKKAAEIAAEAGWTLTCFKPKTKPWGFDDKGVQKYKTWMEVRGENLAGEPVMERPTELYHVTIRDFLPLILRDGLKPRRAKRENLHNYPPRVFMSTSKDGARSILRCFENLDGKLDFVVLKIDPEAVGDLYVDQEYKRGVYTRDRIGPWAIEVVEDLMESAQIDWSRHSSNISVTGTEKRKLERKLGIKPGTDAWFKLWFARPYLTGEQTSSAK